MLDIFKSNAFTLTSLTDAINKLPFVPGRLGAMGLFEESGMRTLDAVIEEREGILYLVPAKSRGSDPTPNQAEGRKARILRAVHLPVNDRLNADEIQGIRAFGSETELQTIQGEVDVRMSTMKQAIETTHEFHRVGAIRGIVLDADGTTVLYNLFDEFGISAPDDIHFDLLNDVPVDGNLRKAVSQAVRSIISSLGATPILGVHALCGDNFFDALLSHHEIRASYVGTPMASVLRDGFIYPNGLKIFGAFEFGGVVWENYRGSVGSVSFIGTNECRLFPVGVPGLFKTRFAPANYTQTVNTVGLAVYAKQTPDTKDRWIDIDVQSNPLTYCTRPRALVRGLLGS